MSTNDSSSAKKVSSSVVLIVVGLVMLIFRIYLLGIVLPLIGVVRTANGARQYQPGSFIKYRCFW